MMFRTACSSVLLGCVVACSAGCSPALPEVALPRPSESIREAYAQEAAESPRSAHHLKLAREQAAIAASLLRDGDHTRAAWVLVRADADAELALALAKEKQARGEALAAQQMIRDLEVHAAAPSGEGNHR